MIIKRINRKLIPWLAAIFLILTFGIIIISFHLVGPLYTIRRVLREMGNGRLFSLVSVRSKDEFKPIVQDVTRINKILINLLN